VTFSVLKMKKMKKTTDYNVMLDADVFSTTRKGKPIDSSIGGVGGAAEQVRLSVRIRVIERVRVGVRLIVSVNVRARSRWCCRTG
jgi:hypothetical protein